MKTKLNDIMKQSRARMCQALLLYGCFFTAPFCCLKGSSLNCIIFFVLTNSYGHPHREVLEALKEQGVFPAFLMQYIGQRYP